jgi:hypothetical protein
MAKKEKEEQQQASQPTRPSLKYRIEALDVSRHLKAILLEIANQIEKPAKDDPPAGDDPK